MKYLTLEFLSAEAAATAFHWANVALVVALIVGVIATYFIYVTGTVKERYTNIELAENRKETARANESAAKAQERAAQAELETAKARLETEQIRQQIAGRSLTKNQIESLKQGLERGSAKSVHIIRLGDREANVYATQLANVFAQAGIQVQITDAGVMAPPPYGIQVFDTPDQSMAKAFSAAGIQFRLGPPVERHEILVGLKLPPS